MIDTWLEYEDVNGKYVFGLTNITETQACDEHIRSYLGSTLLQEYRAIEYLKVHYENEPVEALKFYLKNYVLPGNSNLAKNVAQGDFGEMLAGAVVSTFRGLDVPAKKLRWKMNREKSVFCTDMIAHNPGEKISDLYYFEVKSRVTLKKEMVNKVSNFVTVNAHNSLLHDEQSPNEGIADFLSRYYWELDDVEKSKKYQDIVKNPSKYKKHFELFFIIDKAKYHEKLLDALNDLPPTLEPLNVTVVLIDELSKLIGLQRKSAIDQAIETVLGGRR